MEIADAVNLHGQQLQHWPIIKVDRKSIERVAGKFARGLYYLEQGRRLPEDATIEVGFAQDRYERLFDPEIMPYARKTEIAKDTLTCWRVVASDNPVASMSWFALFRWNILWVATMPKHSDSTPGLPAR